MNFKNVSLWRKALCLLLVTLFAVSALAGCNKNNDELPSYTDDSSAEPSKESSAVSFESSIISMPESSESSEDSTVAESSDVDSSVIESSEESSEESSAVESSEDESSRVESSVPEESSKPDEPEKPIIQINPNPDKSWENGYRPSPFDYGYPTPENIENNIFWDSLVYTGYNMDKHIADGLMWEYILAGSKREKGWLSKIGYAGGSLGYETTAEGKPDIEFFEKHGLVCASYLAYVYFNYLPNVCGIDTSVLEKPTLSYSANDWYLACKKWVEDGYSRTIDFKATNAGGFIKYEPAEEIPIGSVLCFRDVTNTTSNFCRHVCIYAGYKNGYHWVYHVGNDNGPEFCAVERMTFGEGAQWPTAIFATPDFILEAMNK